MRPHHRGSRFAAHGRPLTYACVCGYLILFSAPLATAQGSLRPVTRPPARNGGLIGLLDRPLPGTPERELYDCCERLRSTLAFCDGVQAVRVSAAAPPDAAPDVTRLNDRRQTPLVRPLFVIQISFAAQGPPPHLKDLSSLCMLQAPGLTRDQLTFVDSSGRALTEATEASASPPAAPAAMRAVSDFRRAYAGLGGGAAVLCLAGAALAMRRRRPVSRPPARTPAATAPRVAPEVLARPSQHCRRPSQARRSQSWSLTWARPPADTRRSCPPCLPPGVRCGRKCGRLSRRLSCRTSVLKDGEYGPPACLSPPNKGRVGGRLGG